MGFSKEKGEIMNNSPDQMTMLMTKARVPFEFNNAFADWQAELNAAVAKFPGFVSLEILLIPEKEAPGWTIIERFSDFDSLEVWKNSANRKELLESLKKILPHQEPASVNEIVGGVPFSQGVITEVFVTRVTPDKEKAYRLWIAKIHKEEAKFPGFRGMYLQSPASVEGENWITLLQFDTQENLDRWLFSPERKKVLNEAQPLILSLESHRIISPYAGWFSSITQKGEMPSVWKQTMLILLVLFPIVMLEMKFLPLLTGGLNPALAMFISNAISVVLLAWPMTPFAIKFLTWWLLPSGPNQTRTTILGLLLVIGLYLLEIALFWNLI
jgi:antibiotic biosynthesis monooxygenase (ABM) superfamily enzyme